MKISFSPSVNIRHSRGSSDYLVSQNSQRVFNQFTNDWKIGVRAFSLIGSYGTGKSSFISALESHLQDGKRVFKGSHTLPRYEFVKIIGSYESLRGLLAKEFRFRIQESTSDDHLLRKIQAELENVARRRKSLMIVIDEFGKCLEFAANTSPEREMYFVQSLAELFSGIEGGHVLLTSLHQDIGSYGLNLTRAQRGEWDKVKGRLKELPFNETIEQLLGLAADKLDGLSRPEQSVSDQNRFKAIKIAMPTLLRDDYSLEFSKRLRPFDVLSGVVLTAALQRYGQNERSLFTFIETHDHHGLRDFLRSGKQHLSVADCYDYLQHNYFTFLTSKHNPHFAQWAGIRTALDRQEGLEMEDHEAARDIIKTVGLLNIFAPANSRLDDEFVCSYLGKESARLIKATLSKLAQHKLIRYVGFSNRYILFEGTDLDIEIAIDEAGRIIEQVRDVVSAVKPYFDLPVIPAKSVYYEYGTPRFFRFELTDHPTRIVPEGEIDGIINLVISGSVDAATIKTASSRSEEAVLYVHYKTAQRIGEIVFEIEKARKVREQHADDKIAVRELDLIISHQIKLLNHHVEESLYLNDGSVEWYWMGKVQHIDSRRKLNSLLSKVCKSVYSSTPVFRSELVNKTKLSGAISTAKRNLLQAMVTNWDQPQFGFPEHKFPPEKTIYLSLIERTGIQQQADGIYTLVEPTDVSFEPLWEASRQFLVSAQSSRQPISKLIEILSRKPFKLKSAFRDIWVQLFLFIHRDEFALFDRSGFVPNISGDTLELMVKLPETYHLKFYNIRGVKYELFQKYRIFLNQSTPALPSTATLIQTIRPFLSFYRSLPDYAKNTSKLSQGALAVREAIAKSVDPEKTFFDDFPTALGYTSTILRNDKGKLVKRYIGELQESIREIRSVYDRLIDRVEATVSDAVIGDEVDFEPLRQEIGAKYGCLRQTELTPDLEAFLLRLVSPLEDRVSWLASVSQVAVNKLLEGLSDAEEAILISKLRSNFRALDNALRLRNEGDALGDYIHVELTSTRGEVVQKVLRLHQGKIHQMDSMREQIKKLLSNDHDGNVAALAILLQEEINAKG